MQQILSLGTELKGKLSAGKDTTEKAADGGGFALELGRLGKNTEVSSDELAATKTAIVAATKEAGGSDQAQAANRSADDWLALIEKVRSGEPEAVEDLQEALQDMQDNGGLTDLVEQMKSQLNSVIAELQALIEGDGAAGQAKVADTDGSAADSKTSETTELNEIISQASELTEALLVFVQRADMVDRDGTKPVMGFEPLQKTMQKQVEVLDALAADLNADSDSIVQALPAAADELMISLEKLGVKDTSEAAGEASLRSLLGDLTALLKNTEDGELVAVDGAALREKLGKLLDTLEWQGKPLSSGEKRDVLALLQAQLDSMENTDKVATEAPAEPKHEAIQRLLSQLNNLLEREQGEVRLAQPEQRGGNVLPPVLQALAKATEQLRNEAQAGAAAAAEGAVEEDSKLATEGLRRLFNELNSTQQTTADTKAAASQQTLAPGANQAQGIGNRDGAVASAQARSAQETMTQTPQESARQLQQAVDILGPQAPNQLRERIAVMFNSRTQAAEIRLDPPDLGRMQIRVNLNQEQASVNFQVASPQAREALEQSMPRLRELLAENGIQLADSNVSEQKSGSDGRTGNGGDGFASGSGSDDVDAELAEQATVEVPSSAADGRIDYYA